MSGVVMSVEAMEIDEPVLGVRPVPVWAQPIMSYMVEGSLPGDEVSARQIQRRSKAFIIINSELYKRSATTLLQRCVEPEDGQEILRDIHQGECGHHASSRAQCFATSRRHCPEVRGMSEIWQQNSHASLSTQNYSHYMAI